MKATIRPLIIVDQFALQQTGGYKIVARDSNGYLIKRTHKRTNLEVPNVIKVVTIQGVKLVLSWVWRYIKVELDSGIVIHQLIKSTTRTSISEKWSHNDQHYRRGHPHLQVSWKLVNRQVNECILKRDEHIWLWVPPWNVKFLS